MIQINCNLSGVPTDVPILESDSGVNYPGRVEGNRVAFDLPDTAPPNGWAATIRWSDQAFRVGLFVMKDGQQVPLPPGSYEGGLLVPPIPTLDYAPPKPIIEPLHAEGIRIVTASGRRWFGAMMTGFCDYAIFLDGGNLRPQLQEAKDLGSNGRRAFGMMANLRRFRPQDSGDRWYDALPDYCALNAEYRQYVDFAVFADAQIVMPSLPDQQRHWQRFAQAIQGIPNILPDLGNELPKNGIDQPDAFGPIPGFLCSQGSNLSREAPRRPGWDVLRFHGRRDYPKVYVGDDDMWFLQQGVDASGHQLDVSKPLFHDEPCRFGHTSERDPELARITRVLGNAWAQSVTFHADSLRQSNLLDGVERPCAEAFFAPLG